jgi:hypothetical protein
MDQAQAVEKAAASKAAFAAGDYAESARLAGELREWAAAQGKQINQGSDGTLRLGDGGTPATEGTVIE